MNSLELFFIALALSFDAFAVSVAAASTGWVDGPRPTFRLSFHFGLFQFMMPILGWAAGARLEPYIAPVDHWIAFTILCVIGLRMIRPPRAGGSEASRSDPSKGLMLVTLATATSIDALAVGLSLGVLGIDVWIPSVTIGVVTACVSLVGISLGTRLRQGFGRRSEQAGGLILIAIAVKIVWSHIAG
ncbi:MAG: manganese efflux pump MntP family protein [bacterium]